MLESMWSLLSARSTSAFEALTMTGTFHPMVFRFLPARVRGAVRTLLLLAGYTAEESEGGGGDGGSDSRVPRYGHAALHVLPYELLWELFAFLNCCN